MYHIFGHTSPDTDAFASAFVFAHWLNAQNLPATAYRLGKPNLETAFVLEYLHRHFPDELKGLPSDILPLLDPNNPLDTLQNGDNIGLTDHNEQGQSIANLAEFNLCFVIDHHKISLNTPTPAYVRIHPVGCTCTILYQMFCEKNIAITPMLATFMLCAIISDTLNLTSPITTDDDKAVVNELLKIIGLSSDKKEALAQAMFDAKSDIRHLSAYEILLMDYKEYDIGGETWGIAGIETVDVAQILSRLPELTDSAHTLKSDKNLDHLMVAIVDIKAQVGYALAHDHAQNTIIACAFNATPSQGMFRLDGVVSRKKQIVPALATYYQR